MVEPGGSTGRQSFEPAASVGAPGISTPTTSAPVGAPASTAPRKSTKLMVDLATAIRATTEAARDQALAAVEVDATEVTGAIRAASTEGTDALRRRSDEDLTGIKEWSKAEIARIRQETDTRIADRKALLETEIAAYAAAVEHRIGEVEGAVARYRADMAAYFETLASEEDPARLATMAEAMPEPLALDAWGGIAGLDLTAFALAAVAAAQLVEPEAVEMTGSEAAVDAIEPQAFAMIAPEVTSEPETLEPGAVVVPEPTVEPGAVVLPEPTVEPDAEAAVERMNPWGIADGAWLAGSTATDAGQADAGDPARRAAIMAALEAAAEAVATAEPTLEPAPDPFGQAETAADVAEPAAAFDTQSFNDRLARLLPGSGDVATESDARTTQVVVTGLVSVASIASFKRHLGRLAGVQAVGVASGPEGEFVFHVTHRPDVSFRDVIPSMPGFAARVTSTTDGVVTVTARDPEAEG